MVDRECFWNSDGPTLQRLWAKQVRVPLDEPVWLGAARVEYRDYCLVGVESGCGLRGTGLAFSRGADVASVVLGPVWDAVKGGNPLEPEALSERMLAMGKLHGVSGIYQRAVSVVDLAVWDLKARALGCPLHDLLGGCRREIPVMMAGGYYGQRKGPDQLCAEFLGYAGEGYRQLKLIVGGASMEEDALRYLAVRDALGPEITLGVDANGAWKEPRLVLGWLERLASAGKAPEFLEEPLPPHDLKGLSWLTARSPVPLAVGEFLSGRQSFLNLLQSEAVDILRADMTLCGGVTEWRAIAALAGAWNKPVMPHYFSSLHLHGALGLPGSRCIEVVSTAGKTAVSICLQAPVTN